MVGHNVLDITPDGWWQVARRVWAEAQRDQVLLLAAGVTFYAFPTVVSGLVLAGHIRHPALGFGLVLAVGLVLTGISGAVDGLVTALNIVYDEQETRGFIRRKLLAGGLAVGGTAFVALTLALVAGAPHVLDHAVGAGPPRWGLEVLRWLLLLVAMTTMLAVLYRVGPDRAEPRLRWVSLGAGLATGCWLVGSLALSLYVHHVATFRQSYGALAGLVALMLWLWMTVLLTLLGAEVNAEAERASRRAAVSHA